MKMSMKDLKSWMTDHPYPRTLATIGGASICSMLALELPSNHELWKMQPGPALLELLLIFCFLCLLFYLPHRRKTPAIVGIAALASIGIAEYFVITFKSMPIHPETCSPSRPLRRSPAATPMSSALSASWGLPPRPWESRLSSSFRVMHVGDRRAAHRKRPPSPSTMRCLRP